jgi:adiponectin receptor
LHWTELPDWQQDNQHIHSGYRSASNSYRRSIASLGYIHNESVNIYSHLVGAIFFILAGIGLVYIALPRYPKASTEDILSFSCFFLSAATCLGMSATYHLISNHSLQVATFGNKLDYIGIVILIVGSVAPSLYYGLYSEPELRLMYWTMVSPVFLRPDPSLTH